VKALVSTAVAGQRVELRAMPEPSPDVHEAVVAVEAFSLNRGEVRRLVVGHAGQRPGQDVAGHVVAPAADGSGPPAGTRVVGHVLGGSWAERVAVPVDQLTPLPDGVPATTAAGLPMAGLTALRVVRALGGQLVAARVLLTGAGGGVGHLLVELMSAVGADVTAVASRARDRLLELGATRAVPSLEAADGPYDVVVESLGGAGFARAFQLVAPSGTILWMGQASGDPITLDFFARVGAGINPTIRRFSYWPGTRSDAEDLAALVRLVATDRLHPEVGLQADWADTADVIERHLRREVSGNAVLTVGSPWPAGTSHRDDGAGVRRVAPPGTEISCSVAVSRSSRCPDVPPTR
jgi:NADPH:quinone reductase